MKRFVMLIAISLLTTACQSTNNGVTRLDNCVCYKSSEGQKMPASSMAWQDPDTLQEQFSHCICRAYVDLKEADDPGQFFVPGTQIRTEIKTEKK